MIETAAKQSFAIIILALLSACSGTGRGLNTNSALVSESAQSPFEREENRVFMQPYLTWKGTPYKLGGSSRSGVDCSAFVQSVFIEAQQKNLPRTTIEQSKLGKEISLDNAQSGDLVFFRISRKVRHVGIYLGDNQFMHASTSNGVMISRLDNPYWASVVWQVRRVI